MLTRLLPCILLVGPVWALVLEVSVSRSAGTAPRGLTTAETASIWGGANNMRCIKAIRCESILDCSSYTNSSQSLCNGHV